MSSLQNPNAQVLVSKWSNLENAYLPIISISPSGDNIQANQLKVLKSKYASEFNLKGLECNDLSTDIPPVLADYLPGAFASKLIATQNPTWYRSTDFAKMVALGNRDVGCYRIVVHEREKMDTSLIRDQAHLDEVIGRVHVAVNTDQLNTLLDSKNFYSLTATRGETPKIEYQDEEGERWVVKTGNFDNGKIGQSMTKMEEALLSMLDDYGVKVPESKVHVTPEGIEVLMTKRFDLAQPIIDPETGIANHANKMAVLTLATLQKVDAEDLDGITIESYADAARMIQKHSTQPDADTVELLKRALFDVAVNNTSTHTRNISLVENFSGYELAPTVGVLPSTNFSAMNMPITKEYPMQSSAKFDSKFIDDVAKAFDLPLSTVKREVCNLATFMLNRESYMKFIGMDEGEINQFKSAFISDSVWSNILDQSSQNTPLSMLLKNQKLTDENGQAPQLS